MKLSKYEKETIILTNEEDIEFKTSLCKGANSESIRNNSNST